MRGLTKRRIRALAYLSGYTAGFKGLCGHVQGCASECAAYLRGFAWGSKKRKRGERVKR